MYLFLENWCLFYFCDFQCIFIWCIFCISSVLATSASWIKHTRNKMWQCA